jgi:glycosyltransferase involved in cell wall biosynthesis
MRIAQVAPLYESVPPRGYGGTERIVHYLTEELIGLGNDVTLFASGDSKTSARLVRACPRSLRLDARCEDALAHYFVMLELVYRQHQSYDVIHFHIDYLHFLMCRCLGLPQLTTLHGRLDIPDLPRVYRAFSDMPVVSISSAQRAPLPEANWAGTVLHGLPKDLLSFTAMPADYFVFLGRISPEKRLDRAIEIARALGTPLRIAAKIDKRDQAYFDERIAPLLDHPLVQYLGEVTEREKSVLLGGARALLFPIDWPEPFGLVMIEAMACGTPVVAFDHGSVREVVEPGVTGFIVQDMRGAIDAARQVDQLDRKRIRATFESRFDARRMAQEYLDLYRRLLARRPERARRAGAR